MKSDIEIKDDVYEYIKGSELEKAVTGKLTKRKRPANSTKEDIVINVVANLNGQIQGSTVYVNIYVQDDNIAYTDELSNGNISQTEENTIRLRELARMASNLLEVHNGGDYRWELQEQRIFESDTTAEHIISNKLNYSQSNE